MQGAGGSARGPGMCGGVGVCHPGSPPGAYLCAQGEGLLPAGSPSCYPRLQRGEAEREPPFSEGGEEG